MPSKANILKTIQVNYDVFDLDFIQKQIFAASNGVQTFFVPVQLTLPAAEGAIPIRERTIVTYPAHVEMTQAEEEKKASCMLTA